MPEATKRQTLFNITDDFEAIWALMEEDRERLEFDPGAKPDAKIEAILEAFQEEMVKNLEAKADGYAYVIAEANAKANAQKEEAKRIAALAKTNENKAEKLKSMLLFALRVSKRVKLETPFHKLAIQKAGGNRAVDVMVPAEKLPEKYQIVKTTVDPNKEALRIDLEAGIEIRGVALMERSEYLRIR